MIIEPTSEIMNLPHLTVMNNCIDFMDTNWNKYTPEELINSKVYIIVEDEVHLVTVINKPLNVNWLLSASDVNQFYINDSVLTDGKDIHLKFFVHRQDWIDSKGIMQALSYVDLDIRPRLEKQIHSKVYFPTVLIDK